MRDLLLEMSEWVSAHAGVWGTRAFALAMLVGVYGLVWFALASVRDLLRSLVRAGPERGRLTRVAAGVLRCAVAVALLVWVVRGAFDFFPDWLGIR